MPSTVLSGPTTSTQPTATIRQFASIIAGHRPELEKWANEAIVYCGESSDAFCRASALIVAHEAEGLASDLRHLRDTSSVPPEIAALVSQTIDTMDAVTDPTKKLRGCGNNCTDFEPIDVYVAAEEALSSVASWTPYM